MSTWPAKDPQAIADYGCLWVDRLDGDTISASSWTVPSGITRVTDSFTDTITTIWLSGGTVGERYEFVNHIVTAGGREWEKTVYIRIRER